MACGNSAVGQIVLFEFRDAGVGAQIRPLATTRGAKPDLKSSAARVARSAL